jgi:hypothetical protein
MSFLACGIRNYFDRVLPTKISRLISKISVLNRKISRLISKMSVLNRKISGLISKVSVLNSDFSILDFRFSMLIFKFLPTPCKVGEVGVLVNKSG